MIKGEDKRKWFNRGMRAVQFPVCACRISDEDEMLHPCQFHIAWRDAALKRNGSRISPTSRQAARRAVERNDNEIRTKRPVQRMELPRPLRRTMGPRPAGELPQVR